MTQNDVKLKERIVQKPVQPCTLHLFHNQVNALNAIQFFFPPFYGVYQTVLFFIAAARLTCSSRSDHFLLCMSGKKGPCNPSQQLACLLPFHVRGTQEQNSEMWGYFKRFPFVVGSTQILAGGSVLCLNLTVFSCKEANTKKPFAHLQTPSSPSSEQSGCHNASH